MKLLYDIIYSIIIAIYAPTCKAAKKAGVHIGY